MQGRFEVFMLEDESGCLDYFSVANESSVFLHAGVSAESISRIHLELDEVAPAVRSLRDGTDGRVLAVTRQDPDLVTPSETMHGHPLMMPGPSAPNRNGTSSAADT